MRDEISIAQKLEERVKELSCLYEISSAIHKHSNSITHTLEGICNCTKKAWLYPENAIVHLKFKEFNIRTF